MKRWKELILTVLTAMFIVGCSNDDNEVTKPTLDNPLLPKKELRGVWMATVWGIDWPSSHNAEQQKQQYTEYLDFFKQNNINAVFVQVRGMGDAFYNSPYEPWSQYLTGTLNQDPGYDVLKFMIDEAHKRGIAFHAWINPYRIATRASEAASFPQLDSRIPASMIKDYKTIRIYNPALPEVRNRIVEIIKDIITKYDVDGIHMDDYFYPFLTNGEDMNDKAEYELYGKEKFAAIADFRRDNVNQTVKALYEAIKATRPEVAFSISPAANMDNNYNVLYANILKWSQEGWTDFMVPQLYFATGTSESSFNQQLHWWSQFTYNNALMVGYGIYKFGDIKQGAAYQSAEDLQQQFNFAATKPKVKGSLLYSAKNLLQNPVQIMDVIKKVYATPAILPYLGKGEPILPTAPTNVRINGTTLQWDAVPNAYYAVYRSNGNGKEATVESTTHDTSITLSQKGTYFVTALNIKNNAESKLSELVTY